jgi:hypothetical protein
MKSIILKTLFALAVLVSTGFVYTKLPSISGYDAKLCSLTQASHGGVSYAMVKIDRTGNRIRADYMAATGSYGAINNRFNNFKASHPNIVAYSSGAYMIADGLNGSYTPQGLTIDHGLILNEKLETEKFDALVIVYTNGGIAVSDLDEDNIKTDIGNFKIRSNTRDLISFKNWAKSNSATIFQTHLLAKDNQLKIEPNKCQNCDPTYRRFLIASKDNSSGKVYHYIVQRDSNSQATLYQGAKDAFDFLQGRGINVTWMINLDTGMQDTFSFYTSDGIEHSKIHGTRTINDARNLLVYYYE